MIEEQYFSDGESDLGNKIIQSSKNEVFVEP